MITKNLDVVLPQVLSHWHMVQFLHSRTQQMTERTQTLIYTLLKQIQSGALNISKIYHVKTVWLVVEPWITKLRLKENKIKENVLANCSAAVKAQFHLNEVKRYFSNVNVRIITPQSTLCNSLLNVQIQTKFRADIVYQAGFMYQLMVSVCIRSFWKELTIVKMLSVHSCQQ